MYFDKLASVKFHQNPLRSTLSRFDFHHTFEILNRSRHEIHFPKFSGKYDRKISYPQLTGCNFNTIIVLFYCYAWTEFQS